MLIDRTGDLGYEIAGVKTGHGRAGVHQHVCANVVDRPAAGQIERPCAVRVPDIILALNARVGQQRAVLAIERIDPAKRGGGVFAGGRDGKAARPHLAQQVAPAGRAGGIRHEQRVVIRRGGGGNVRIRRHCDDQAAGHGLFFIGGGGGERRRAVHRGERGLGQDALRHPVAQGGDPFAIGGQLRREGQRAVGQTREIAVIRDDAEIRQKPAHLVNADQIRRDFVLLEIAVGIARLERQQHVGQFRHGGRHGQIQRGKPLCVDPHADLSLRRIQQGEGGDPAVAQRDGRPPIGVRRQQRGEVGHVGLDQWRKVDQRAAFQQGLLLRAGEIRLEEHIRRDTPLRHGGNQIRILRFIRNGVRVHGNAGQRLHAREKQDALPVALDGFGFKPGERRRARRARQQGQGEGQRKGFFQKAVHCAPPRINLP